MVTGGAAAISSRRRAAKPKHSSPTNRNGTRLGPAIVEEYDSEYETRPKLGKKHIQRSIRQLEASRRERRFHAKILFREFALPEDEERMHVDRMKAYMAKVIHAPESDLSEEAMALVLDEAKKKSPDAKDGILTKHGAASAVIKYGEYARHCKVIHKLFQESDHSRDGKLQRSELRKMIEDYERTQHRSTQYCDKVMLFVTEHDLDFILEFADANNDGDIDHSEVVRAIGAWEELATIKLEAFEKPKCCTGCTIS